MAGLTINNADHQTLINYIDSYVRPQREKLQKEASSGANWEGKPAFHGCLVINSKDLVLSGYHLSPPSGDKQTYDMMKVDYNTDIRFARVLATSIATGAQGKHPYVETSKQLPYQNGYYSANIQGELAELDKLHKQKSGLNYSMPEMTLVTDEINRITEKINSQVISDDIAKIGTGNFTCIPLSAEMGYSMACSGVENYYVCGIMTTQNDPSSSSHAFLVTTGVPAYVLDPSFINENGRQNSHLRILNTEADITKGDTLVAIAPNGELRCYGTGKCDEGSMSIEREGVTTRFLDNMTIYDKQILQQAEEIYKDEISKVREAYKNAQETAAGKNAVNEKTTSSSMPGNLENAKRSAEDKGLIEKLEKQVALTGEVEQNPNLNLPVSGGRSGGVLLG